MERPEDKRPYRKYDVFFVPGCEHEFADEGAAWEYIEEHEDEYT